MPLRTISSAWTPSHKFVVPVITIVGAFNFLVFSFQGPMFKSGMWPFFVGVMALAVVYSIWQGWAVKRVSIDMQGGRLYISNYLKEIEVPIADVASVSEFMLSRPRRITLHLRHETEFGNKIRFLAKYRFLVWTTYTPHPIVEELNDLIAADPGNWRSREQQQER